MKNKKIISIILVSFITIASSIPFNVQASTKEGTTEIERQAIELASKNMDWNNVKTSNIKEVYDFNNNVIAYSVDLENESNSTKGFELIDSTNTNNVIEFSKEKLSPFDRLSKDETPIYSGPFNYFSKDESGKYFDLKSNNEISRENINKLENINNQKKSNLYKSHPKDSYKNLNFAKSNIATSPSNTNEKILSDVPDEIWYRGCSPTAIGMVLEYDYYDYTPEFRPLVDILAKEMSTDSAGFTYFRNFVDGTKKTMKQFGVDNIYVVLDGEGRDQSTYDEYVKEIDENHPVVCNFLGSGITSSGYPNGFKDHSCAGVGYKKTGSQRFLVVHTDGFEGNVYVDFDSPKLGTNVWLYIH